MRRVKNVFKSVFTKTLYDKRWFIVGWSLGVVGLLGFTAAFFPTFKDSGFDQLFQSIPTALKNMMGELADYGTFEGYTGSAVFGLRAQMLFVPLAIILGFSLGVSEEANRKMYQLLAQPISRQNVVLQKYIAGLVAITFICLVGSASVGMVAALIGEQVIYELLTKIFIMSTLFTSAIFSVTYGVGKMFGRKNITLMVPVIWVMFSIVSDAFSSQTDWLRQADFASVMHYFRTSELVHHAIEPTHMIVLGSIMVASIIVALITFPNRDLREG